MLRRTRERSVTPTDDGGVHMEISRNDEREVLKADDLFAFTGRQPSVSSLGLDTTLLDPGEGWVRETMQARDDPCVFVVGDATGEEMLTHVAKEEGYRAGENILVMEWGEEPTPYRPTTHHIRFGGVGVYPFVKLGLAESDAADRGVDYVTVPREASDDDVFAVKDVPRGVATLVVDAADGTVLGYQSLHYHADVMAKTMQLIIEKELDIRDVPDRAYHPTNLKSSTDSSGRRRPNSRTANRAGGVLGRPYRSSSDVRVSRSTNVAGSYSRPTNVGSPYRT